jgi:hypothetical protein
LEGFAGNSTLAYVADSDARLVYRVDQGSTATIVAGQRDVAGTQDGAAASATFTQPTDLALARDGTLYIIDGNAIRRLSPQGQVTTLAGSVRQSGFADGSGSQARFNQPSAMALGPDGALYVADMMNFLIRKITPAGAVSTVGGIQQRNARDTPIADLVGAQVEALAVTPSGDIFYAHSGGEGLSKVSQGVTVIAKMAPDGTVTPVLQKQVFVKPELPSGLGATALASDADGNVYFVSDYVYRLRAGGGGDRLAVVSPAIQAAQLSVEAGNQLWVADRRSNRLLRLTWSGIGEPLDPVYFTPPATPPAASPSTPPASPVSSEPPASPAAPAAPEASPTPASPTPPAPVADAPPSTAPGATGESPPSEGDAGSTIEAGTPPPAVPAEALAAV